MLTHALAALAFLGTVEATEPWAAARLGAVMAGHHEYAAEVLKTCRVESGGCKRIGIHRGHMQRKSGLAFYRSALARGDVNPDECPAHRDEHVEMPVDPGRWGIRGAHGNAAAYAVEYLQECAAPEAMDVPLLSAIVTARRLHRLATRYGRKTARERGHAWRHGVGCECKER